MEGKMNASLTRSCRSTPRLFSQGRIESTLHCVQVFSKCLSPYTFLKKMVFSNKAKTAPSLFALSRRSMQPWTDGGGRGNPKLFCFSTWLPRPSFTCPITTFWKYFLISYSFFDDPAVSIERYRTQFHEQPAETPGAEIAWMCSSFRNDYIK